MSAIKFEAARIHFLSDVFVAVAVVDAVKLPKCDVCSVVNCNTCRKL